MDTTKAFIQGAMARIDGNRTMVFDWDKAASLIAERKPKEASAGLRDDWEWTGGSIYVVDRGPVCNEYTYLASTWAVPELNMDGDIIECWRYKDECSYDSGSKWPDSAVKILKGADQ